jgi:putative LysE/RhtB family amino acid efflux pump
VKLDRISDRVAWLFFGGGFAASVLAAAFAPQDVKLGAWVRLVIWHGMLKWAVILVIFAMGGVAVAYLVRRSQRLYDWVRALQIATLMTWVFAVAVGAVAAKLVWNSWNLTERRMTMSVIYIMVAAIALIVGLALDKPRLTAALTVVSSITMAGLLLWIELGPATDDVHPANAVMGSDNVLFRVFGMAMLVTCLVCVLLEPAFGRAVVLGVAVAAPVGAISMLCMQRTLARGRAAGYATGLGIATADGLYAAVAAFGLTAISNALVGAGLWVRLVGGVALLIIGVRTVLGAGSASAANAEEGPLVAEYTSAVALTLANPQTIVTFAALFAGAGLAAQGSWTTAAATTAGVVAGSALWWAVLVTLVALGRHMLTRTAVTWVSRVAGAAVVGFALWLLTGGVGALM